MNVILRSKPRTCMVRFSSRILLSSPHSLPSRERKNNTEYYYGKQNHSRPWALHPMKGTSVTSLPPLHNFWLLTMRVQEVFSQPAVWSETPMQLVEAALTKHNVPLITYRVLPWKTTQSDIQNEQYLILNNGLGIAENPLLPEINTLSRRTGILLSSGAHNTYTYVWNISKENTQTFFLTFKQK